VEFNQPRVCVTALRQVLRGLVPRRRQSPTQRAWQHENLLFLCTTANYEQFTFAHFRGEQARKARLATFGWQQGDRYVRTLCEHNRPALRWPEDDGADADAWLAAWAKAFDKEPLTREFFKRFDRALNDLKSDLEECQGLPPAEAYTRSQLLLERMIFLHFLQKRGWLNQQRGYLLHHFQPYRDRPEEFSYYEEFLERLFWTLSSPPGAAYRLDGVPFLNGGLFDDEFAPTPIRRRHNPPLRLRNATFAQTFDEFLERFNFTVREDTPLNQEVAVDPEMLGKVFESIVLHAEAADPDAVAPDKRKATGSYYTPRIVVHFICREALRQYLLTPWPGAAFPARLRELLEIDASDGLDAEELRRLRTLLTPAEADQILPLLRPRCCDPAVGSGAFPVGLLHELLNLRRLVETVANGYVDPVRRRGTEWLREQKEDLIQNCLYGVDIQQQAIEICRLRLWLSLVVDYDLGIDPFTASRTQFERAIQDLSQLPNLEMNFRRGDSLHDFIGGVSLLVPPQYTGPYRSELEAIGQLGEKLHHTTQGAQKRQLRVDILRRRLDLSQRVLEEERKQLRNEGSATFSLFEEITSPTEKRKRLAEEMERVQEALRQVAADRQELERLAARRFDSEFERKLRRLEGAEFDSPFNFVWRIDFAAVFSSPSAIANRKSQIADWALAREERPFVLWAQAEGDFDRAAALILSDWPSERRALWTARLRAIRDNEHLRRIEQPVYKRRWDEQWKVGSRWQCGPPAYDAELLDAFAWWLSEKAEWWLETQRGGGPVTLEDWADALWTDPRVPAATEVAAEASQRLEQWKQPERAAVPRLTPSFSGFARFFKALVKDQSVPEDIPFAAPWEQISVKVPAPVKQIRGKLNVPRERFRVTAGAYMWAGRDLNL